LTEQTRQAVDDYLKAASKKPGEFMFTERPGRSICPIPIASRTGWAVTVMCGGSNVSPRRPPAGKPGQQNRKQAGDEYAVESAGAADRYNGRPEALQLTQIEDIGPDQDAEAAPGIGERRGVPPGDNSGGDRCGQRRHEDRYCNPYAVDLLGGGMADRGNAGNRDQAAPPKSILR
jgi:hypothetical protein